MRVLIVDDHSIVRTALAAMLAQEPDIEIVGTAADGKVAVEMARDLLPDIVLMDINMPAMNGLDATRMICAECPSVKVIALSMFQEIEQAQPMLDAGAASYVCKSEAPERLLAAIRCHRTA